MGSTPSGSDLPIVLALELLARQFQRWSVSHQRSPQPDESMVVGRSSPVLHAVALSEAQDGHLYSRPISIESPDVGRFHLQEGSMKVQVTSLCVTLTLASLSLAAPTLAGQTAAPAAKAPSGKPTAGAPAKAFVPKRLPWGDPDISGNFTSKDEANTPFERPDKWAGRRIEDITPAEMAKANEQRRREALAAAPYPGGGSRARGVAIAVPIHWFDSLDTENARPWLVFDPPDGKVPPLTDAAVKRQAEAAAARRERGTADSYTDRSLGDRCVGGALGATKTAGLYGNSTQILQTKDFIGIRYESHHETRMIPIEGRGAARPRSGLASIQGDAIAHWEGDTLVVDTTNYNGRQGVRGSGARLHTIEKFRRVAPNKVEFTATFEDRDTWARPWSTMFPLTEDDTQAIFSYECHEGNYGLRNILSAGRSDDRKGIKSSNAVDSQADLEEE